MENPAPLPSAESADTEIADGLTHPLPPPQLPILAQHLQPPPEPWTSWKLSQHLYKDGLLHVLTEWTNLEVSAKLSLLFSFIGLSKRAREDVKAELEKIILVAEKDIDEWVNTIAYIFKEFPETGVSSTSLINHSDHFKQALDRLKNCFESTAYPYYPLEYQYLCKPILQMYLGNDINQISNDNLGFKPKSSIEDIRSQRLQLMRDFKQKGISSADDRRPSIGSSGAGRSKNQPSFLRKRKPGSLNMSTLPPPNNILRSPQSAGGLLASPVGGRIGFRTNRMQQLTAEEGTKMLQQSMQEVEKAKQLQAEEAKAEQERKRKEAEEKRRKKEEEREAARREKLEAKERARLEKERLRLEKEAEQDDEPLKKRQKTDEVSFGNHQHQIENESFVSPETQYNGHIPPHLPNPSSTIHNPTYPHGNIINPAFLQNQPLATHTGVMPPDFRESRMSMQSGYPFSNTSHSEMPPANMTMSPALMSINRNHISPNETYHDHDPNRLPSLHYQPQVANDGRQSQSIVNSPESFQQPFVNHAQSQSNLPTPFMPAPIQHSSNYPAPTQDSYFPPQPQFHQQSISQTPSPVKSFAESHSHSHIPNVGSLPVQDSSSKGHPYPAEQAPEAPQVDEDTIRKVFEQCNALNEADKKLIYDFVTGVNRVNPNPSVEKLQFVMNETKSFDESRNREIIETIVFEANYSDFTWRKVKKKRAVKVKAG